MGGSQSRAQERVVTVEERVGEDGEPQITVTEDFLKYLQSRQKGESHEPEGRESPPYPGPSEEQEEVPYISAEELLTGEQGGSPGDARHQKSEDSKWKQRYEYEKKKNENVKQITSEEFDKAVSEVREKFTKPSLQGMVPLCEGCKDRVLDCYHSNPGRTLNCSSEVKEYTECVEKARKGLLEHSQPVNE